MTNIPVQQQLPITKLCTRFKTFEDGIKLINVDNVCSAMERGMLVGPTIAHHIVGLNQFKNIGSDYQKLLVNKVQKLVLKHKLTMSILSNSNNNS